MAVRLVVLAAGAVLVACSERVPRDPLDFVPPDAAVVAQVHAPSLVRSSLVRKHLLEGEPGRELDELVQSCGYDPLPQVDRVTFAMVPQGVPNGEFAAVVEGRLDPRRLVTCARRLAERRASPLETVTWSGAKVLRRTGQSGVIALVDGDPPVVVLGEGRLVRAMLRQERAAGPSFRRERAALEVLDLLGADRSVRLVVRPTAALREEARRHLEGPLAPLADAAVLGLGIGTGARLDVTLLARLSDPGAARRVAREVEEAAAAAEREPLLDLTALGAPLRSFAAEARGRDVVAVLSVTERQLEAIAAELQQAGRLP